MNTLFDLIALLAAQRNEADQAQCAGGVLAGHAEAQTILKILTGEQEIASASKKDLEAWLKEGTDPAQLAIAASYCGTPVEAACLMWNGARHPVTDLAPHSLIDARGRERLLDLFAQTPHAHRPLLFDMLSRRWKPILTPRAAIAALARATQSDPVACAAEWHGEVLPPYTFRLTHPVERSEQATLDGQPEWNWRGVKLILSSDPSPAAYTARGEAVKGLLPLARLLPPFTQVEAVMLAADSEQTALRRRAKSALKLKDCPAVEVTDLLVADGEDLTGLPYKARLARLADIALIPPFQRTPYDPRHPNKLAFGSIHKSADAPYGDADLSWTVVPPLRKTVRLILLSWQRDQAGLGIEWGERPARLGEAPPPTDGKTLAAIKAHVKSHTAAKHGPVHEMEADKPLVVEVSATALLPAPRRTSGFVLHEARIEGLADGPADSLGMIRARFSGQA